MTQQLENIKTAIRTYPAMSPREAAELVGMMMSHFSATSDAGETLLDCMQGLELAAQAEDMDTRPADESWKARQDSALSQSAGFDLSALANLRIRGAI